MSSISLDGGANQQDVASTSYIKLNTVAYHWSKNVASQPFYNNRQSDAAALRTFGDTRIWLPSKKKGKGAEFDPKKSIFYRIRGEYAPCIEVHVAYMHDTRMTLLFSLEEVQMFAREMKKRGETSKLLLTPSALTPVEMKNVERIEKCLLNTAEDLGDLQKKVERQNKKVTHEENIDKWAKEYEEVRRIWREESDAIFIGFDVETYEVGHDEMLEVGFSIVGPHHNQETYHYIIEEAFYNGLRNGRYVADNRKNFLFGVIRDKPLTGKMPPWPKNGSEIAASTAAGRHFLKLVGEYRKKGPVHIVFHDSKGDMKVMNEFGINTKDWTYGLIDSKAVLRQSSGNNKENAITINEEFDKRAHSINVLDTQQLFAAIRCGDSGQMRSLKNICIALNVNDGVLNGFHNAANDAFYTAAALVKMATGPHLTSMRELAQVNLASEEVKKTAAKKPKFSSWN